MSTRPPFRPIPNVRAVVVSESEHDNYKHLPTDYNGYVLTHQDFALLQSLVVLYAGFYAYTSPEEIEALRAEQARFHAGVIAAETATVPPTPIDRKRRKWGHVYLAWCETGHYKIGRSKGPVERIKVFDTQMPVKVELVHTIECDDYVAGEDELHSWYDDKRHMGEWFALEPGDVEEIKALGLFVEGCFWNVTDAGGLEPK